MKKSLKTMLADFLKHRSKCENSGWPVVADADIEELYAIVGKLLEMKYEKDCDGSLPVEVSFVDRTKFERSHYFNIPYEFKAKTNEERMEILSRLNTNVHMAANALDMHVKMLDMIRHEGKKT